VITPKTSIAMTNESNLFIELLLQAPLALLPPCFFEVKNKKTSLVVLVLKPEGFMTAPAIHDSR